jgi:uncharacterized protein (TIGR02466 family)
MHKIEYIFPTPIYQETLKHRITSRDIDFCKKIYPKTYANVGNLTSQNNYVLNERVFSNLKKELLKSVNTYFKEILSPKNKLIPYITQSWLNFTNENQFHQTHNHPISIVSGVYYLNVSEGDNISFHQEQTRPPIYIPPEKYNLFNSRTWTFKISKGLLVLFPSSLLHSVNVRKGDKTRISLAFNTFVKGTLGTNIDLDELTL